MRAGRRADDAREHEMDDVLGEIVLAGRNENLLAGDRIRPVGLGLGPRLQEAEIGAAMRLGEVHRSRPAAGRHRRRIEGFLRRGAVRQKRRERPLREAGIKRKGEIGGGHELAHRHIDHIGQPLSAMGRIDGKAEPAALDIGAIGLPEALRRRHAAVRLAPAALTVARRIELLQNALAEVGRTAQNRFDEIGRRLGKARQIGIAPDLQHIGEQKRNLLDGGLVARHESLLGKVASSRRRCRPARGLAGHADEMACRARKTRLPSRQISDSFASGREHIPGCRVADLLSLDPVEKGLRQMPPRVAFCSGRYA